MIFETAHIILRPWAEGDAESLYKYASDERVGPAAGWNPHKSVEESLQVLHQVLMVEGTYAVVLKETMEPIGSIAYFPSDTDEGKDGYEIGYWLAVPYWGRGLIPEATTAILAHIFSSTAAENVWCCHFLGNEKSHRVIEKCGFKHRFTAETYWAPLDKTITNCCYAITRGEYLERYGDNK